MTEALQPIGAEEIVMLMYSAMFSDGGFIEFVAHDEDTECMFIFYMLVCMYISVGLLQPSKLLPD